MFKPSELLKTIKNRKIEEENNNRQLNKERQEHCEMVVLQALVNKQAVATSKPLDINTHDCYKIQCELLNKSHHTITITELENAAKNILNKESAKDDENEYIVQSYYKQPYSGIYIDIIPKTTKEH